MTRQIAERQGQHLKALRIHIDHADQPRILIQPGSACHNVLGTHTIPECIKVECDIQASHLNQEHQDTPASRQRPCPAHPARYFPRSPAAIQHPGKRLPSHDALAGNRGKIKAQRRHTQNIDAQAHPGDFSNAKGRKEAIHNDCKGGAKKEVHIKRKIRPLPDRSPEKHPFSHKPPDRQQANQIHRRHHHRQKYHMNPGKHQHNRRQPVHPAASALQKRQPPKDQDCQNRNLHIHPFRFREMNVICKKTISRKQRFRRNQNRRHAEQHQKKTSHAHGCVWSSVLSLILHVDGSSLSSLCTPGIFL